MYYTEEEWERRERERDTGSRAFQSTAVRLVPYKQGGPDYDLPALPAGGAVGVEPGIRQLQSLDVKAPSQSQTPLS